MSTLTDLLPVRFGLFDRAPRQPKHSAPAEVERLRRKLTWADLLVKTQQVQIDDAEAKQLAAEELAVKQQADIEDLTAERDHWRDKALALQARFGPQLAAEANANRITVPAMQRIGADQDTQSIDVTTLREAAAAGRLGAVRDPGQAVTQ
ncbi:hypothetical protein AB5J55_35100 [Streptomyces sp. R11]|uniref:Uncharacterized protein n=1 Tax=Streptomyces sp. R11 TaxID=3238625 RepID=A0AB39N7T6_9ACTN